MAMPRKLDNSQVKEPQHGKRMNQKLKPYVVMQFLLKYSDENHPMTAFDIIGYLNECGIEAERRSIYRDIEDINKVYVMMEDDCTIEEAEETIATDDDRKIVIYDRNRKGFYVNQFARHFELSDIRLIAECIYSAKFIPQSSAQKLADVVFEYVSEPQAEKIKHDSLVVDRVKTLNKAVLNNIGLLRDAMASDLDGQPHIPEKISFNYLTHEVGNVEKPIERRRRYVVSPFYLIINDSNYYLLAFDDASQDMRTYRVDRMKNINFEGLPRDGEEVFRTLDMKTYTQRVFSMFGGEKKTVRLQFTNSLLDTVIDRFGNEQIKYSKVDAHHFRITAEVEVSPQFFSWLCGFGSSVQIITPQDVKEEYIAYLNKIINKYE